MLTVSIAVEILEALIKLAEQFAPLLLGTQAKQAIITLPSKGKIDGDALQLSNDHSTLTEVDGRDAWLRDDITVHAPGVVILPLWHAVDMGLVQAPDADAVAKVIADAKAAIGKAQEDEHRSRPGAFGGGRLIEATRPRPIVDDVTTADQKPRVVSKKADDPTSPRTFHHGPAKDNDDTGSPDAA